MIAPEELETGNRETNEVLDALSQIKSAIEKGRVAEPGVFTLTGVRQATHVRMRLRQLVISADNAGATNITVTLGTRTFVFPVVGPLTLVLPPPQEVLDRGVDCMVAVSAGALGASYLTFTPE